MGYTDTLLAQGEVISRRGRQHWLALLLDSRAALGVWTVALLLLIATVFFNLNQDIRNVVGIIILVLVIIGLVIFAYRWLRWMNQDYVVTNRRILKVEGIINKRSADSSLEKINDLVLEENLLGRMLGYGDLDIITASEVSVDRFRMLNRAKEFKRVMLDEKHRLETGEDSRMPGPPLMASSRDSVGPARPAPSAGSSEGSASSAGSSEGSASSAGSWEGSASSSGSSDSWNAQHGSSSSTASSSPSGAGSSSGGMTQITAPADPTTLDPQAAATAAETQWAPASGSMPTGDASTSGASASAGSSGSDDTRDVTQTLARLADLRDRGAITAQDYDQKKTELLGRL